MWRTARSYPPLRLVAVALAAVLGIALSGCVRYHADLVVSGEDTVSGTVVLGFSADDLAALNGLGSISPVEAGTDPLAEIRSGFDEVAGRITEGTFDVEPFDDDSFTGYRADYAGIPADEIGVIFAALDGGLGSDAPAVTLRRTGSQYVFEGMAESGGSDVLADVQAVAMRTLLRDADARVSVTFPGAVIASDGEVVGSTVTWRTERLLDDEPLRAVGEASAAGPGADSVTLLLVLGAVAVLSICAVAALVLTLRSHPRRPSPDPGRTGPPW